MQKRETPRSRVMRRVNPVVRDGLGHILIDGIAMFGLHQLILVAQ